MQDVLMLVYLKGEKIIIILCRVSAHLFECELKLSSVEQELKQDPGVVLGVVEHLIFDLTQPLVVQIIGCKTKHARFFVLFCINFSHTVN